MGKTIKEINEKIRSGNVVVVTAEEIIDIVKNKGIEKAAQEVDVVGSLCENNDKFAVQRHLPPIDMGDLLIIHDTGAHGHAMGFNYNGKLRPKELLFRTDGRIELIRRAETMADYFATLEFDTHIATIPIN